MATKQSVQIHLPTTAFRRPMFFNRVAVERKDGFVFIHFGFVNGANVTTDSYSTAISELELSNQKKTTMDYLGKQGALGEEPPAWQPMGKTIELCSHVGLAHHGPIAETALFLFSLWSTMAESRKPSPNLNADAIALLRSSLATQQHLIRLLFPANDELLPQK